MPNDLSSAPQKQGRKITISNCERSETIANLVGDKNGGQNVSLEVIFECGTRLWRNPAVTSVAIVRVAAYKDMPPVVVVAFGHVVRYSSPELFIRRRYVSVRGSIVTSMNLLDVRN